MRKPRAPRPESATNVDEAGYDVPGRDRAASPADVGLRSPEAGGSLRSEGSRGTAPSAGTPALPERQEPEEPRSGVLGLAVFGRRERALSSGQPVSANVVSTGLTERLEERRRAGRRLRLRRLTGLVLAAVALAGLLWVFLFSPVLALRAGEVRVSGSDGTVEASQVQEILSAHNGTSLLRLSTGDLGAEVAGGLVRVRSAEVSRHWFHGLDVRLRMRVPVAVHQSEKGWEVLDGDAVLLETAETNPGGLVVVGSEQGSPSAEQVSAVARVVGGLDVSTREKVATGSASATGQVTLVLTSGATVVWGDTSDTALKAKVLSVLVQRGASTYDVSSPHSPTTS